MSERSTGQLLGFVIVTFAGWTITSFLCHYFGKGFLISASVIYSSQDHHVLVSSLHALALTLLQLVFCITFVRVEGDDSSVLQMGAVISHVLATFSTNLSLSLLYASSTAAIKLTEPVTSAVLQCVYLRQPVSKTAILCLLCVVGGATIFVGIPTFSGQYVGIISGLVSNFLYGLRNVLLKKGQSSNSLVLTSTYVTIVALTLCVGCGMSVLYQLEKDRPSLKGLSFATLLAVLSAICHVTYSYISTALILKEISVVSHAVANIVKRAFVVLLLYAYGHRVISWCNFLGLGLCVIGLVIYTWEKFEMRDTNVSSPRRSKKIIQSATAFVALIVTVFLFLHCTLPQHHPLVQSITSVTSRLRSERPFTSQTFYHNAFVRPSNESLLPELHKLPPEVAEDAPWFLEQRLIKMPVNANFISKQLTTSNEIIREAQRIHFNMLEDYLKKYKYAMWFDVSDFQNKGDSCVTVGETYFLRRLNIEVIYYCNFFACNKWRMDAAKNLSRNYSPDDLVILGHGGGNLLGYHKNDEIRYRMIERFKDFQIFIFPQGIWIPNNDEETQFMKKAKKMYCCVPNLTIVLREAASYHTAQRLFRGSTHLLMSPDIAFQVGPIRRIISPVFDILYLKRTDKEDPGKPQIPPYPQNLTLHISEWIDWKTNRAGSRLEQAHYNAANGHLYLQRGRVVITDRLHGHIFSILNDIPHVLVDPLGGKLTNYHYTWTASLKNVRVAKSTAHAIKLAIELLDEYKDTLPAKLPFLDLSEDFKPPVLGVPNMKYP